MAKTKAEKLKAKAPKRDAGGKLIPNSTRYPEPKPTRSGRVVAEVLGTEKPKGRPPKPVTFKKAFADRPLPMPKIDQKQFEYLCSLHCTRKEVAGFFKLSERSIDKWAQNTYATEDGEPLTFKQVAQQFRAHGRVSLRRRQYMKAVDEGDTKMLIHLGKEWLDQGKTDAATLTLPTGVPTRVCVEIIGRDGHPIDPSARAN